MTGSRHAAKVVRNPLRGFLGGTFLGIGAVILVVVFGLAAFSAWWPFVVIVGGCAVLGTVVGLYAPARASAR